ncbi:threonine--tRNA ligase [bacterium]|nr:threonine--tRNA ligase [bacterium]
MKNTAKVNGTIMGEKLNNIRHSLAHLLAMAALEHDPDAKLTLGPTVENGFYYDIEFSEGKNPSPEDLKKFEKKMKKLISANLAFTGREVLPEEAREFFKDNPYKLELIDEIESKGEKITLYETGDETGGFTDLCRGGHVKNTSEINPDAFMLTHIAGAYWRGDEKNTMLTRIYGLAFETAEALAEYRKMQEEAMKRDHKKLGVELDLFTFSDLVGAGLPLWTPKGTLLRTLLDERVWELRKKYGYERVEIPHITKKELYEKSGHWEKFKDELFRVTTREGHEFAMKPMNCPHHTQIYARKPWSYRELPQRYANTTMCYRDEQSGELSGLSRARSFTQDDAHVFSRLAQVKDEVRSIYEIITNFYGIFDMDLRIRLSIWDKEHPEKYLGGEESWTVCVDILEKLLREIGKDDFEWGIGEAAFYGPKIDFMGKDSLGREHQVATIQLDMNMPERFDLTCMNEKGEKERVVMIHAAIMGSIERFLAVLIEHTGGAFPFWLAPVQVAVLPVSEKHHGYAKEVFEELKTSGMRAELHDENESLGKKIRNVKTQKIPYFLVVGDKEIESKTVTVEDLNKGSLGQKDIHTFILLTKGEGLV